MIAKNTLWTSRHNGFTLVELMVIVAIVGILAAVAYPSYNESAKKTRRGDGMSALVGFANAMERHFTENNTYAGAATGGTSTGAPAIFSTEAPIDGSVKNYNLTIQSADGTSYTLRATPKNAQAGDGILELTSLGVRSWDKNNNGNTTDSGENSWEK